MQLEETESQPLLSFTRWLHLSLYNVTTRSCHPAGPLTSSRCSQVCVYVPQLLSSFVYTAVSAQALRTPSIPPPPGSVKEPTVGLLAACQYHGNKAGPGDTPGRKRQTKSWTLGDGS